MNMTCLPVFGTYYVFLLAMFLHHTTFLCIPHQSPLMRQARGWLPVRRPTRLKSAVSAGPHDPQEPARLDEDSERSSIFDYRSSPHHHRRCLLLLGSLICGCMLHMVSTL